MDRGRGGIFGQTRSKCADVSGVPPAQCGQVGDIGSLMRISWTSTGRPTARTGGMAGMAHGRQVWPKPGAVAQACTLR